MRWVPPLLLIVATWLVAAPCRAAPCPVDPAIGGDGATSLDVDDRLAFIESSLRTGARRSTAWAASWGTAYGLSMTTLLIVAPFVDSGTKRDVYVGAFSSGIGFLFRLTVHPRVIREDRWVRRLVRERGRTCETLNAAERALARSSKGERRGRSLLLHLGAVVYNVGVGLVLGLALKRPLSGIRQATVGGTVGQIMIVTQPVSSVRAHERYRLGAVPRLSFSPLVLPGGAGLTLTGGF